MYRIAVIGMGCAGYHAVKALRENGFAGQIHMYSDTAYPPANPMLTTYYVSGRISKEGMFPFGSLEKLQEDYDVVLHLQQKAEHVHAAEKQVVLSDGTAEAYDKILIATGARAVSPALGQGGSGKTFLMRTVSDAVTLKEALDRKTIRSAVVIGASMVGIKVAELLREQDISVSLVDMADRLFALAAMHETAEILEKDLIENRQINLLLNKGVERVAESETGVETFLTDGTCLASDILVLCIGTRANVELVANTQVVDGEPVKVNRGIVADAHMQTNIPGIYAAGDCCEALNVQTGETMIIGLWANAAEQGRIAGINMAGKEETYKGSIPSNITHYFDRIFIGIGDPNLEGKRYVFKNSRGVAAAICNENGLQCVNMIGNYRVSGMIKEYLIKRVSGCSEPLSREDEGLLRSMGVPEELIGMLR